MTLIAGIIIGVLAMWLREWVTAKPSSPLLRLPAADLRAMIADLRIGHEGARQQRAQLLSAGCPTMANDIAKRLSSVVAELAELHDALRIVEARETRETPSRHGAYR